MDGGLASHPGGVDGALVVLDVLGHAEPEVLHVGDGLGHVGGDLIEVVEAHQRTRGVEVVAPCEAFDVVDVVEEFVREAQGILHAHRIADAVGEALGTPLDAASQFGVEGDGLVEVFWRAHPVGERGDAGDRSLAQHQVVVDELLQ